MHLSPEEKSVLDVLGEQGSAIVDRAVGWCAINSGSRNIAGGTNQMNCSPEGNTIHSTQRHNNAPNIVKIAADDIG